MVIGDAYQWGIWTVLSLKHGDTFPTPAGREHWINVPMSGEDVQLKLL